ncbi:hypothetical protein [Rufibacter sp. LB8]|uniref:hypothetical protein n=1 Tax=Rufibacter sp. LB8 TaxID=2777781 RepID=UPI00178C30CA|nr:hypothetical protein [Rufibacter sp. LB8]
METDPPTNTPAEPALCQLTAAEQEAPYQVITWLFDKSSVENLREDVWQYFKAATSEHAWFQLDQPYDAIAVKDWLGRLMEASWLLLQRRELRHGEVTPFRLPPDSLARLEDNRAKLREYHWLQEAHGGRIRLLRQRELDNPYLVLKDFFLAGSLPAWRELLTAWTEYALCYTSLLQDTDDPNLVLRYEHLQKLLEAAYYISHSMGRKEFELLPAQPQMAAPQHRPENGAVPAAPVQHHA